MPRVINSVDEPEELFGVLSPGDLTLSGEEEIEEACREAALVAADPLYKAVIPQNVRFIPMPHVAFSGRIYRDSVPDLTAFHPGRCAIL